MTSDIWDEYYRDTNPSTRHQFLLAHQSDDTPSAYEFRQYLFNKRYPNGVKKGATKDAYILSFINLLGMYNQAPRISRVQADLSKELRAMGFEKNMNDEQQHLLYLEIRNAVALYMSTAKSEHYHSRFMGLITSSEESRMDQMCIDCWKISIGNVRRAGMEQEAEILVKAFNDEFVAESYDAVSLDASYRACS